MNEATALQHHNYKPAPPGFSPEEWDRFLSDGFLVLKRLTDDEIYLYLDAFDRLLANVDLNSPSKTVKVSNLVEKDPVFRDLIDHQRHIGYAYDIYGEQLKLIQSEAFFRPRGGVANDWHYDGPRLVPYRTFSPILPLKIRIGYWLTDLPYTQMGNFVYFPGSHLPQYRKTLTGNHPIQGERIVCLEKGSVTIANGHTWHRVEPNYSDMIRKNLFMSYSPSWVCGYDDHDSTWVKTLTREQRIIIRPYEHDQEAFSRPPAQDLPLYLDRDTNEDTDASTDLSVEPHKRRRLTMHEKLELSS